VRAASDAGTPIVAEAPDGPPAQAFIAIARRLWVKVEAELAAKAAGAPRIVVS
jgi:hypothetical protein